MTEQPRFIFSSKAEVLETLHSRLSVGKIVPMRRYEVSAWNAGKKAILAEIQNAFDADTVIVRSSAVGEDSSQASHAGAFLSVGDVHLDDGEGLRRSIDAVVSSYPDSDPSNEFFVQPFLRAVACSGVVFTRDLDRHAPYYVINYDDATKRTDTVTSGTTNQVETLIVFRRTETTTARFDKLIRAVQEIEQICATDRLDVEFAIGLNEEIYILQVRQLAATESSTVPASEEEIEHYLRKIAKKVDKLSKPQPYLDGERTFFGVMPDWNPAEIIGVKPRKLALSLYKELVTDRVWAYQRYNYGYRDVRSVPLIVTFLGVPYVDIRASFNSFVPAKLRRSTGDRLVAYYLDRLKRLPELHDKVEFDIVFSCYTLGLDERLQGLREYGFDKEETREIKEVLVDLTNRVIDPTYGMFERDLRKIHALEERHFRIVQSDLSILEKIYWLSEDCKRYGTLPFAGVARSAFIAVQLLRSFVETDVISERVAEKFMNGLETVSSQIARDVRRMQRGDMSVEEFQTRYGHLRPGSYDIMSLRYDENWDAYFGAVENYTDVGSGNGADDNTALYEFPDQARTALERRLDQSNIEFGASNVLDFIRRSIEGREYAKFVFSKNLSAILKLLVDLGAKYGISRHDMSHVDIQTILQLYATLDHRDLRDIIGEDIERNKKYYRVTESIRLPHLILESSDVFSFRLPRGKPNFVTLNRVEADVLLEEDFDANLNGHIVFIESADPGYDWIFAQRPAGLVTMYGGANSHMAIRCAEIGLPAVIGAGERNFSEWRSSRRLEIVCAEEKVRVVC